jgi:hypothetical protein
MRVVAALAFVPAVQGPSAATSEATSARRLVSTRSGVAAVEWLVIYKAPRAANALMRSPVRQAIA